MIKRIYNSILEQYIYERYMNNQENKIKTLYYCIHMFVGMLISHQICKIKGHKFEECGSTGPESGSINLYCKRCGYEHSEWLY